MSNLMQENRGSWGSKFGFIMAAVGGAVGLGNIWRFPYVAGQHGGAIFLIVYIFIIVILGFPMVSLELSVGRHSQSSIIGQTFKTEKHNWSFLGWISILTCFLMISYYLVIGGWLIKYFIGYISGGGFLSGGNAEGIFNAFTTNKWQAALYNLGFLALCLGVLMFGIKKGIEKISKILMPALLIMLIFVAVCSLSMPGAIDGVKFFFVPNFQVMKESGGILGLIEAAMGQAFFSLSIGMGVTITYGSYLKKHERGNVRPKGVSGSNQKYCSQTENYATVNNSKIKTRDGKQSKKGSNIASNTIYICILDSLVAIIAGLAVLPAVFSSGQDPSAGAGLLFIALPNVFATLGTFGIVLAVIFFLLVLFAALTSAISVLEVMISSVQEKVKSRIKAVIIVGIVILISSTLVSLSQSGIFGIDLLELFDMLTIKFLLPISAFLVCLFTVLIWGKSNAVKELTYNINNHHKWTKWWEVSVSYISPVLIFVIFMAGLFSLNFSAIIF